MELNECVHKDFCGGCTYQGIPYDKQLETKKEQVISLFREEGLDTAIIEEIEGCEERYFYRNKMEYTFGDMEIGGPLTLGMHKKGHYMSVVTTDECQIVPKDFNRVLRYTLDFCRDRGYSKYHKKRHDGLLRNLVIRAGMNTHEILVNIVVSSDGEFDEEAWKDGLLALELDNDVAGILLTVNDQVADKVERAEPKVLFGREYYEEVLLGKRFKVHAFSFFQTNIEACERLYSHAVGLIDDIQDKNCYDLYCGSGTITQVMAQMGAREVVGVEIVPESVDSANENKELNGLHNCRFICGDVFEVLEASVAGESEAEALPKPDVIVVDPPRVGISKDAVDRIASYGVDRIVYISCNPKTLVRNLTQFRELGYSVVSAKPFDNFPMTSHVECCSLLVKTSDSEV